MTQFRVLDDIAGLRRETMSEVIFRGKTGLSRWTITRHGTMRNRFLMNGGDFVRAFVFPNPTFGKIINTSMKGGGRSVEIAVFWDKGKSAGWVTTRSMVVIKVRFFN